MRLYIIRHGETLWNTEKRLQGRTDIALNENGIRLARITAEGMKDIPFDLAITSPLRRAEETARLVLGNRNIPVLQEPRIAEISFGPWEGLCCKGEGYEIPSGEFPKFFTDPFSYIPPEGGESVQDVCRRTKEFYEELIHRPDLQNHTILIAAHGCSSRGILNNVFEDKENFWRGKVPPNCAVSVVDVQNGRGTLLEMDKIYYSPDECRDFYGVNK